MGSKEPRPLPENPPPRGIGIDRPTSPPPPEVCQTMGYIGVIRSTRFPRPDDDLDIVMDGVRDGTLSKSGDTVQIQCNTPEEAERLYQAMHSLAASL